MTTERFRAAAAVHLFLIRGGRVLLLRRANTGYQDGNFSAVAGHLDGGEEVRIAAAREADEEVGVTIAPANLQVAGVMHRLEGDERIDFFLTADRWQGEPRNDEPHKCAEIAWFPLGELPDNVVLYVRRALERYRAEPDRIWYDAFGWNGEESIER